MTPENLNTTHKSNRVFLFLFRSVTTPVLIQDHYLEKSSKDIHLKLSFCVPQKVIQVRNDRKAMTEFYF